MLTRAFLATQLSKQNEWIHRNIYRMSSNNNIQAFLEGSSNTDRPSPNDNEEKNYTFYVKQDVKDMKVVDLRKQLKLRQMDTQGKKQELVQRLLAAMSTREEGKVPKPEEQTYILEVKGLSTVAWDGTGVGLFLHDGEDLSWSARKFLKGNRSVFEAEYSAVVMGLRYAIRRGVQQLILRMDHDVVAGQINGTYPVSKESLRLLYWAVMHLKESFRQFQVQVIKDADNQISLEMASKALATGKSLNIEDDKDPVTVNENEKLLDETAVKKSTRDSLALSPKPEDHKITVNIFPEKTYLLRVDGGARGNPGIGGAGMVIYDENGKEIWCGWKYLGPSVSNNSAEYEALITGMQCAKSLGIRKLLAQGDSNLIVRQMHGTYRVKEPHLQKLYGEAMELRRNFEQFEIEHIPRQMNKRADWLANHAMDERASYGFDEQYYD